MFFKRKYPEVSVEWLIHAASTLYHNLYLAPKPDGVLWTWAEQVKLLKEADIAYREIHKLSNELVRLQDARVERRFRRTAWRFLDDFSPAC